MPLARYFLFVGASLLTLLFVVDAYLPKLPDAEQTNAAAGVSVIRIHSDRKWPERVVFDTTVPSITPATTGMVEAKAKDSAPTSVADVSPKVRVRDVFAQLPFSQPADLRKPEPKPKRKAVARSHPGSRPILVAQQPRIGFFGNNIW
jgi:hypothetical protein